MRELEGKSRNPVEHLTGDSFPLRLSSSPAKCPVVWAVAGFDPSSGAGVTADLMTFAAHGLFGCSAITALTVQTTQGVFGWEPVASDLLEMTLRRLYEDLPYVGLKIGMLGSAESALVLGRFLQERTAGGQKGIVVFDPVLRSSSGKELFPASSLPALHRELLPSVDWITPNWAELALLAESAVVDLASAESAARRLQARHPRLHVVATGGDQDAPTDLLVEAGGQTKAYPGEHVATTSTHGTGCAFSSSLLSQLVLAATAQQAVAGAKAFVTGALRAAPGVGQGRGPMGLLWPLRGSQVDC